MGIVSLTLGITSLIAWIDPVLGFPISGIGLILGAIALWRAKEHRKKALVGLITSVIGLLLNVIVVVGLLVLEILPQYSNW